MCASREHWRVIAWAGLALVSRAVREESLRYCPRSSRDDGVTNRYKENHGVSKRVYELAFGIVICFGSEGDGIR